MVASRVHLMIRLNYHLTLWDQNGRSEGDEWEPLKKLLKPTPIHCPKQLSSNRQDDTSQLVTCSS